MKEAILGTLLVAYIIFMSSMFTSSWQENQERGFVCDALGYDSYSESSDACVIGKNPIMLYPYEAVLENVAVAR